MEDESGPHFERWQQITIGELLHDMQSYMRELLMECRAELKTTPAEQAEQVANLRNLIDLSRSRLTAITRFQQYLLMGKDISLLGGVPVPEVKEGA